MLEQLVIVKGTIPISKEAWDEIWRDAPHVDLRKGPAVAKPMGEGAAAVTTAHYEGFSSVGYTDNIRDPSSRTVGS